MDAGPKTKKSPQQAEQNENNETCSHAHGNDYSIWDIPARGLGCALPVHAEIAYPTGMLRDRPAKRAGLVIIHL
jgi:hypothetical protein